MNICVLRSGSKGNCTIVWSKDGAVLLDCGNFPVSPFCNALNDLGLTPKDVKGILISHGHGDHINQHTLKISEAFDIPLHIHQKTYNVVSKRLNVSHSSKLVKHHNERAFRVNNIKVRAFETFHEGGYVGKPFGFVLEGVGERKFKIGYLTDTSAVSEEMVECLVDSEVLVIESNNDVKMVEDNDPRDSNWLQHLNNVEAADAVVKIKNASRGKNALKYVFAAHISSRHNTPKRVLAMFNEKFKKANINDIEIIITDQEEPTPVITI
ncbi:MAG: MBL fold metallo-hydrolase [Candidatus Tantalella remota]|nr:MBL fold metallo-hydrolase [Candidatus Tantalella remota]